MALEAVYIDMESGKVVAIKPKPAFLPLFNLEEPATAGSKIWFLATPMGFEPTISSLTSWHVNRYTTGPPMANPQVPVWPLEGHHNSI
jgi:hypothetical protein